jgi:peptidoglycan/LPS O-acetylase OafA/YrhL
MKNLSLEGLRGVASLNVVIGHFLFMFFPYLANDVRPVAGAVARYGFEDVIRFPPFTFLYLADSAVLLFFTLSGYVLVRRFYLSPGFQDFGPAAVKRYIRLGLPVGVSVMLSWMMLSLGAYDSGLPAQVGSAGWVTAVYPTSVSFIGAVFRASIGAILYGRIDLNGPLWTIQVELIGSILLFACYALFGTRSKFFLVLWFLFLSLVLAGKGAGVLYYAAILGGSFLHLFERQLRMIRWLPTACLLLGLIGISFSFAPVFAPLAAVPLPNLSPYGPDLRDAHILFYHTIGAILLVAGVIGSPRAAWFLTRPVFIHLGRLSFAIYLLHFPLLLVLTFHLAAFGQHLGMNYVSYAWISFVITMIVLFAFAELFYRFVDAPSIGLANWLSDKLERGLRRHPPVRESAGAEVQRASVG